jgi:hypothetical protein
MNSTKEDNKSQAQPKGNENPPYVKDDILKQLRNDGVSALVRLEKDEQVQVINWAQDIVNQYGSILKENPVKIRNLTDLPCPKEDLKTAIKVLLPAYIAKGSDDILNLLKDRYIRLGAFQEIREEDKETIVKETNKIDQNTESTETALFPTYQKYMEIIISEQKILLDEVNSFIDDIQIQEMDS